MLAPDLSPLYGSPTPRIGPPVPARSLVAELEKEAKRLKRPLIPWQECLGRYVYALDADDLWLYPEIAGLISRQNGKTEFLKPHIMQRLKMGRRILHAAQTRELPRETFNQVAPIVEARWPKAKIRRGAGQETIEVPTGGVYRIAAATSGGPRGWSMDDLLVDELREIPEEFIQASIPTTAASPNPQIVYLSNAGHDGSKALNDLRMRSTEDPSLAWLEWSAAPDRAADDRDGWLEANPSIGHLPGLLKSLERRYESNRLAGTLPYFETENLCRWVSTMREKLVHEAVWQLGRVDDVGAPARMSRPAIAVNMAPDGGRASIALAWALPDASVALALLHDIRGEHIDADVVGGLLRDAVNAYGCRQVGFDPLTDKALVKYVQRVKPQPISAGLFGNASAFFANLANAQKLQWSDADAVSDDLTWTSRKTDVSTGTFEAVRSRDDRPITASLAAIRAVWLAGGPRPVAPRVM